MYNIIKDIENYTSKKINILEIKAPFKLHKIIMVNLKEDKILFQDIDSNIDYFVFDKTDLKDFMKKYNKRNKSSTTEIYKISIVDRLRKQDLVTYNNESFAIELF